jgi:spore coat polysaccharide biosynthesis protein SpsF
MHVSIIIQARLGSKRLPQKMLSKIDAHSLIEWVIIRLKRCKFANSIILATTLREEDEALVAVADKLGIKTYRGDENNVLKRFCMAANSVNADVVVRVCADNPFIDAEIVDQLITYYLDHKLDYAFNHQARLSSNIADGFGAEILGISLLNMLNEIVNTASEREHLTMHIWNHKESFIIGAAPVPEELAYPELKFDIDTEEDLNNLRSLVNNHALTIDSSAGVIVQTVLLNN